MIILTKATNGGALVDSTSTIILAANDRRKVAGITNGSDVGVWISFGAAAVVGSGEYLAPGGGAYQIDADNLFKGPIYGIATTGDDKPVGFVEFT